MFYVFDLDGTLALVEHRKHFVRNGGRQWRAFFKACVDDGPNTPVINSLLALQAAGHRIEIWSGRSDAVKAETIAWLQQHGIDPALLIHMRPTGNNVPDDELKQSWLRACVTWPDAVYDDRDKVVAMWRREGVACFQVAPGDF
ncbi:MAG: hypothetical protein COB37_08400 [Kordiimonadales bacterium]|nr:MAG: hypothetical protein COB37_08400 [Kordiimonadales bacterium]